MCLEHICIIIIINFSCYSDSMANKAIFLPKLKDR